MNRFWQVCKPRTLSQGQYIDQCWVAVPLDNFDPTRNQKTEYYQYNLLIVTHSCDLESEGPKQVALCPVFTFAEFEEDNPRFTINTNKGKGLLGDVAKGQVGGLHLVPELPRPAEASGFLIVDFGQIYGLPSHFLLKHIRKSRRRYRLRSPYLEHFSQAFARQFMRVELPEPPPKFV